MKINFHRSGAERKALVVAIGEILGIKHEYKGAPTFIYKIDDFQVDKEGTLIFDECIVGEKATTLLDSLESLGFIFEKTVNETQDNSESYDLIVIEILKEGFTDVALNNLNKLIESKGDLIKKALGVEALQIEQTEETLRFPWFRSAADADKVKAYTHFITAICDMAKSRKRITSTVKEVDNEKYAFRCFLLRLGFIGSEYKMERKILLSKLSGSSAFKSGTAKHEEVSE